MCVVSHDSLYRGVLAMTDAPWRDIGNRKNVFS
jgi:hypothetical protein